MEVGSAAEREIREVSGRQVGIVIGAYFAFAVLGCLLEGWIERRFGVPGWLTIGATVVSGTLLVTWAERQAGWAQPVLGAEARQQAAARLVARDRKIRPWLILADVLILLSWGSVLLGGLAGYPMAAKGWSDTVILCSVVTSNMLYIMPSRGEAVGEADARDQALRGDATRVGYVVLIASGMATGAIAMQWPAVGAQCWAPVLLASVMVAQVRMVMLSRRAGAPVPVEVA